MEDAKIKTNIIHSKAGVSTTESTAVLTAIHFLPISVATHRFMQLHLRLQFLVHSLIPEKLSIAELNMLRWILWDNQCIYELVIFLLPCDR